MDRLLSRVLLLLAALVALPVAAADANWWQAEWKYRKPITVDAGPQGAGLAGDPGRTPLLLRLHTGNFGFDGTQDAGNDLRFVSGDGRTVLAHQIEQFDPKLGLALVWVDVPAVSAAAPQTIWMYYVLTLESTTNWERTDPRTSLTSGQASRTAICTKSRGLPRLQGLLV